VWSVSVKAIPMGKTLENLASAFAGESQANRKYIAFARKADEEGLTQIARLFRAAAEAETIHALNHLRIMGEIKTTEENLSAAVSGETYEFKEMYPGFIESAKAEKNAQAAWSFEVANKVEKVHAELYKQAKNALNEGRQLPEKDLHVCSVCGMTVEGDAPDRCPVCGAPKVKFFKVI
jgi:rubrerythrin